MPAWVYGVAVTAVGFVLFVAVFHPFRRGAHAAPRALPVRVDAGSMVLAEEATAWLSAPPWVPPAEPWLTAPLPVSVPLGPYGGQLGPRARLVLDRYEARRLALWGF